MQYFFPVFFILFIIFVAWLTFERSKSFKIDQDRKNAFWEKENEANAVRKKPLDNLPYIIIPNDIMLENLSSIIPTDDAELNRCNDVLNSLKNERILNLTGMTSTDIKLQYGAANLAILDEYDQNFTLLVQTIYAYGDRLHNLGFDYDAMKVLRFGIDSLSDISMNYKLLATLYVKYGELSKIDELRETASKLDSLLKNSIIKYLDEVATNPSGEDMQESSDAFK